MEIGFPGNEVTVALFLIVARLVIPCIAAYIVHRKGYPHEWVFITIGMLFSGLGVLIIAAILPQRTAADAAGPKSESASVENDEAAV